MNKKPYYNMKAPGDSRDTWGKGIIQIIITRACDLSCVGCTQGSNLAGKPMMMTPMQFEEAADSLIEYHGVVGIFGGNPCIHPQFERIARILQKIIPFERRGLWSNNLMGYGKLCREIFNPEVSNLNVHMSMPAYMEIVKDWPEAHPKGYQDSRHSPPFVSMRDLGIPLTEIWDLINHCDINQLWSAMIGVFRGELRAWFCELAGAQSMLHEHEPDYPDTGVKLFANWWRQPIDYFEDQIIEHCLNCGIPLRGIGDLAVQGLTEQVSRTHQKIYQLKRPLHKTIQIIKNRNELGGHVEVATNYIENGQLHPEMKND